MVISRGRLKLLLIVLIFVAPFMLADLAFHFWKPEKYTNYGELLKAIEFHPAGLHGPAGEVFDITMLHGKWVFLLMAPSPCDRDCEHNLYLMRQVRLAVGRDQARIERLVISEHTMPESLLTQYAGMRQSRYTDAKGLGETLARPDAAGRIHLLDPYGRFVMRYPVAPDGTRMIKDIKRLLQYSRL